MPKKPTAKKQTRQSYDRKLAKLAPHEQMHELFHGRPNDGGFLETHLRNLGKWRKPEMLSVYPITLKNGEAIDLRASAEVSAEELKTELRVLTAVCSAALERWEPETLQLIAKLMKRIKAEEERAQPFNPFKPACGMSYKKWLRAMVLSRRGHGTLNQWRLACEAENTNPDPRKQSEGEFKRTESTRKTIGDLCKAYGIRSKVGRPKVEK